MQQQHLEGAAGPEEHDDDGVVVPGTQGPTCQLHVTCGAGLPLALHCMVTLDPALTAILPSWGTAWIEGGTGERRESKIFFVWYFIKYKTMDKKVFRL